VDWKILSSEYLSHHQYFTARVDKCERRDGKIVPEYFVVELPACVVAMALTENNEVLMIKQYRHPIKKTILELPGGFIDKGETPEQAIKRELMEETGYQFDSFDYLGKVAANPGVLDNYTHMFLAKGGKKVSEQELDANEDIEILLTAFDEVKQLLNENKIEQALHAACIFYALQKIDSQK